MMIYGQIWVNALLDMEDTLACSEPLSIDVQFLADKWKDASEKSLLLSLTLAAALAVSTIV